MTPPTPLSSFMAPRKAAEIVAALVLWFKKNQRPMLWRKNRDPYRVWISEIMLQQTQVSTVTPYFQRFIERFPSVEKLAQAPLEDVLQLWSGLGYYSRARNLHRGAQKVLDQFGGKIPDTQELIREVPGIGAYTAGAILSIAYGKPEPIVDGNVARVLSRILRLEGDVRRGQPNKNVWEAARVLVESCLQKRESFDPGDLNQALMELGAMVCTPRTPQCESCPLSKFCLAKKDECVEVYPQVVKRAPSPIWKLRAWFLSDARGQVLFVRRENSGLFGGLWELPTERLEAEEEKPSGLKLIHKLRHVLTHRVLEVELVVAENKSVARFQADVILKFPAWSSTYTESRWLSVHEALSGKAIGLSTVQKKLIKAVHSA